MDAMRRALDAVAAHPEKSSRMLAAEIGVHYVTIQKARQLSVGDRPVGRIICRDGSLRSGRGSHRGSSFDGMERGEEAGSVYQSRRGRTAIGIIVRARGRDLWEMILAAIDAGFVHPNDVAFNETRPIGLRLLFTDLPAVKACFSARWDLRKPKDREFVREVIWPLAIANKEKVLADPTCLEGLFANRGLEENRRREEARIQAEIAALPSNQFPIVMYGLRIWPSPHPGAYGYPQARAAVRFFLDLFNLCEASTALSSPRDKAWGMRHALRGILHYTDREILSLVESTINAMEQHPTAACQPPPNPPDQRW